MIQGKQAGDQVEGVRRENISSETKGRWVNLGVIPTLSDWEVVGLNSKAGMSRAGFFTQGRFQWFSPAENVLHLFSTQQDHLVAYL